MSIEELRVFFEDRIEKAYRMYYRGNIDYYLQILSELEDITKQLGIFTQKELYDMEHKYTNKYAK